MLPYTLLRAVPRHVNSVNTAVFAPHEHLARLDRLHPYRQRAPRHREIAAELVGKLRKHLPHGLAVGGKRHVALLRQGGVANHSPLAVPGVGAVKVSLYAPREILNRGAEEAELGKPRVVHLVVPPHDVKERAARKLVRKGQEFHALAGEPRAVSPGGGALAYVSRAIKLETLATVLYPVPHAERQRLRALNVRAHIPLAHALAVILQAPHRAAGCRAVLFIYSPHPL